MATERLKNTVRDLFEANGLDEVDGAPFESAHVRRGRMASLVFLTADARGRSLERATMEGLVSEARAWCKEHAGAEWYAHEAGLNLVVFHDGQVTQDLLRGLPDATGMHAAIVQSVTAVDCRCATVAQAKTWIVVGRAWTVLRKLAKLESLSSRG